MFDEGGCSLSSLRVALVSTDISYGSFVFDHAFSQEVHIFQLSSDYNNRFTLIIWKCVCKIERTENYSIVCVVLCYPPGGVSVLSTGARFIVYLRRRRGR